MNHVKKLRLPFTIIDVGWWFQVSFPAVLPSGRFDYAALLPVNLYHGDGQRTNVLGDWRDIGRWTARILDDERTLNRYVLAWSESLSDNEIFALVEEATGEKVERQTVLHNEARMQGFELIVFRQISYSEFEAQRLDARATYARDPTIKNFSLQQYGDYMYSMYVRGDNQVEYAKYLGYLDAKELFPDFHPITYTEFLGDLLDGKIEKPQYQF